MLLHEQKFLVEMKRNITQQLQVWKEKTNRKPLIVNGARQVGKTYSLKEFDEKPMKTWLTSTATAMKR